MESACIQQSGVGKPEKKYRAARLEDVKAAFGVGTRDLDHLVKAARAHECRVEQIDAVGGGHKHHSAVRREAVHL